MTGVRDVTQLCFSSNLAGTVANKIEQSFYSVYSCSGIESIDRALSLTSINLLASFIMVIDWLLQHFLYIDISLSV